MGTDRRLPKGQVTIPRGMLLPEAGTEAYQAEELRITMLSGDAPSPSGTALLESVRENRHRLTEMLEQIPAELAGERFKVSHARKFNGAEGVLMSRLREHFGLPDYWIKAEPWPFPVSFRQTPNVIDVGSVAEQLGLRAVLLHDPHAEARRQPADVLLIPVD